jgi:hypothetical protein
VAKKVQQKKSAAEKSQQKKCTIKIDVEKVGKKSAT